MRTNCSLFAVENPEHRATASGQRGSRCAQIRKLAFDFSQDRITGNNDTFEVISVLSLPTRIGLGTETHNATGFIGYRQPGISFCRWYDNPGVDNHQPEGRTIVFLRKGRDFIATAARGSPAACGEESDIRSETSEGAGEVVPAQSGAMPTLESEERDRRIRTSTAQPRTYRNLLEEFDPQQNPRSSHRLIGTHRTNDQIAFPAFNTMGYEFELLPWRERYPVRPVDRLQQGSDLVKSVRTPAQDCEIQIDLCEGVQKHERPNKAQFGPAIINPRHSMRHRILLAVAFAYLCAANLVWISLDTRPPFWDMANHQRYALQVYESIGGNGLRGVVAALGLTEFYPPLYHFIVAGFYAVAGLNVDSAALANLPAILILLLSTYGTGRSVMSPWTAAVAGIVVSFYPLMLWLSRETLIDYWLTAMTALAIWLLTRTSGFSDRNWSVAFGICCGLGMLTKWTFPFFVGLPFLWLARHRWKHALVAAVIAAAIAAIWYVPAIPAMRALSTINAAGAAAEGDPSRLSWQAVVFYWRALEGYQLFLPLFVLFLAGAWSLARNFEYSWMPIVLWAAGGWLSLLLLQNKDPRYSAPLLPAIALITVHAVEKRRALMFMLLPLLAFQHYMVSFGIPRLPESIVLARGTEGPLKWHWNLYTQTYFGLWGPPAREDWRIEYVLDRLATPARMVSLGMVPDIPRFDYAAFDLAIALHALEVKVNRITGLDEAAIAANDYLLSTKADTSTYSAPNILAVQNYIRANPSSFVEIDSFSLPNGETILVYQVLHP